MARGSLTHLEINGDLHLLMDRTVERQSLILESFSYYHEIGWGLVSYLDRKSISTRLPRKESFYKL